jgi:hypothetical protein
MVVMTHVPNATIGCVAFSGRNAWLLGAAVFLSMALIPTNPRPPAQRTCNIKGLKTTLMTPTKGKERPSGGIPIPGADDDVIRGLWGLNETQTGAVVASLSASISLIHGPPGTGKTSTAVRLISAWYAGPCRLDLEPTHTHPQGLSGRTALGSSRPFTVLAAIHLLYLHCMQHAGGRRTPRKAPSSSSPRATWPSTSSSAD